MGPSLHGVNTGLIAIDHATLREVGTQLDRAAGEQPPPGSAGYSVADPAGDAALHAFADGFAAQLRELDRIVNQTAQRAKLTALAFQLLDHA